MEREKTGMVKGQNQNFFSKNILRPLISKRCEKRHLDAVRSWEEAISPLSPTHTWLLPLNGNVVTELDKYTLTMVQWVNAPCFYKPTNLHTEGVFQDLGIVYNG